MIDEEYQILTTAIPKQIPQTDGNINTAEMIEGQGVI